MARNKINFAAQGLYVGPSPATGFHFEGTGCGTLSGDRGETLVKELYRIQGVDYSFDFGKENIAAFGDLAPIDYAITTAPVVNLNFSYLCSNFLNEKNLGFIISSGGLVNALSGIISTEEDRNFFLAIHGTDGEDLHNNPNYNYNSQGSIIGIGNGIINNYSFNVSVGQNPTVNIGVEALNMQVYDKQSSLYSTIMNGNDKNGHFDNVGTGANILVNNFNEWSTFANDTALVKIVSDPTNISESINSDVLLQSNPDSDAYFNSIGTGTNWDTNNTGSFVYKTGNQLVYVKGQPISSVLRLSSGNFSSLPSNSWYKAVINIASGIPSLQNFKMNLASQADFTLRTGENIIFNTGQPTINSVFSANFPSTSTTGIIFFNKIEIFEPKNFSARYYATGSTGSSFNFISKSTNTEVYSALNAAPAQNKRFNLSMDVKYSGFSSVNKQLFYTSLGSNNVAVNPGTIRQPLLTSNFENQFQKISLEFSNSPTIENTYLPELRILRLFDIPDGELWIDNLKLEQTNKTDIINSNLFNGSFETYHPSYVASGNNTITAFSGLRFSQDSSFSAYSLITGSNLLPSYDKTKTYSSQSANIKLINKTGAGSRYVVVQLDNTLPFNNLYQANKRHKFTCYTRYSGTANAFNFKLTEAQNFNYYTETLDNNNSYEYKEIEFIPTGATTPKIELTFNTLAQNGDQIWLDDMNLYYYDDCYELPVVQNVTGGFGLPINPTTNYSGLSTNSNLKSLSVLSPKDTYLNINYSDLGVNVTGWKLQSINLDLPLNRERIYKIDQLFPDYRLLFPIVGNISLNAITTDLVTGDLYNYYFNCNKNYDLTFGILSPCNNDQGINFIVKKAKLNGLSFSNPINGKGQEITMDFIYTIPSPSATTQGLFLSGITDLS